MITPICYNVHSSRRRVNGGYMGIRLGSYVCWGGCVVCCGVEWGVLGSIGGFGWPMGGIAVVDGKLPRLFETRACGADCFTVHGKAGF
jgi:hypothetical protein